MTWEEAQLRFRKKYFSELMFLCDGNISKMARIAGVTRTGLYQMLHKASVALPDRPSRGAAYTAHNSGWRAQSRLSGCVK